MVRLVCWFARGGGVPITDCSDLHNELFDNKNYVRCFLFLPKAFGVRKELKQQFPGSVLSPPSARKTKFRTALILKKKKKNKTEKKRKRKGKNRKFWRRDQPALNWGHMTKGTNQLRETKSKVTAPTLYDKRGNEDRPSCQLDVLKQTCVLSLILWNCHAEKDWYTGRGANYENRYYVAPCHQSSLCLQWINYKWYMMPTWILPLYVIFNYKIYL